MPANLSPEYKAAESAFRRAREPKERLERLREMLRTIPKHKGTDHLQADIKRRIKELSEELEAPRKGGAARSAPALVVRPEGAAQVALVGPPSAGKSALHAWLTGSGARAGDYPFTTQVPQVGMLAYEDIAFQLVDLPAVSPAHPLPWLASALQTADACLLVADVGDPACLETIEALHAELRAKRVRLVARDVEDDDPFALCLPALLVVSKAERLSDPQAELRALLELEGRLPGSGAARAPGPRQLLQVRAAVGEVGVRRAARRARARARGRGRGGVARVVRSVNRPGVRRVTPRGPDLNTISLSAIVSPHPCAS